MCSRPLIGSESMPTKRKSPPTDAAISSERAAGSDASRGACSDPIKFSPRPDEEPGVHTTTSDLDCSLAISVPSICQLARPSFHCVATVAGSAPSTQGVNSAALS